MRFLLAILFSSCTTRVVVMPTPTADVGVVTAIASTVKMTKPSGCTAVKIGGKLLVTAKHCVDEINPGTATDVGALLFRGGTDWAALGSLEGPPHVHICIRNPQLGERAYSVGYPGQRASTSRILVVTEGVVSTIIPDSDGEIRTSAPIYFGNSGGGLWGTDGCLLGLTVSGVIDTAENYIVPSWDFAGLVNAR